MNIFFLLKLMYKLIIVFIIIIIILIIFAVINSKKMFENYKAPTTTPPNYEKYNTELTHIANDPTGEPLAFNPKNNFNYTQLYYAFVVQLFKSLSSKSKKYDKKLVENYAKNTITYNNLDSLRFIMEPLLKEINRIVPQTNFHIVGYESWRIYQDKNSSVKINQIDCWIYDRTNLTQLRVLLEICELPFKGGEGKYECRKVNDKELKTCASETTPEFPTYTIGIPSNNQIIPLPTEVIITGHNVQNAKGINYPRPCPYEKIWINWVEIVGTNLVLNAFENFGDKQLPGLNRIPFDYTVWKSDNNSPYQDPNRVTNQWPTLKDQPKDLEAWPCSMDKFEWDSQGTIIPPSKPKESRRCPGKRHGLEQEPLTASFYNSYFNFPRGITQYRFMFANEVIIPALQYMGY